MKEGLLKIINHYGLENQREYLGKSKKALLKRWHPEQFEAMAYKVGD